jgi:hypothetical protein
MIASTGFVLSQRNVLQSANVDDTYSGEAENLEDDLNYIRNIIRQVKGTEEWDAYHSNSLLDSDSTASRLFGNGIIPDEWNELEVIPNSTGLSVVVQSGKALVEGDIAYVLPTASTVLTVESSTTNTVGDWEQRQGEVHEVPALPSTVTLNYQNVGNLKVTDKFGEPYPNGFREGIDYTVNYATGVITIPPTIESRIALEEIHVYYEWGYDRYDLVEIGENNIIHVKTGTPGFNPVPPAPTERFLPLAIIYVNPFYTTLSSSDVIDSRTFSQYIRNLRDIRCTDISEQNGTVEKVVYYTSSGEVDELYEQWELTTYRDKNVAITETSGTRITTTIANLDNDEFWLLVDKTPWENTVTVEFDHVAGYQELGLNITAGNPSGLENNRDYSFTLNDNSYEITTPATGTISYTTVASLIDDVIRPYDFTASIVSGDIRITDILYTGLDSIVAMGNTSTYNGDLFNNLTGFTTFDTAVDGTDGPATSGTQEVGLEFTDATDPSGLSASTSYYFKINGTQYSIKTATLLTFQDIVDLMDAAVTDSGFTVSIVSNVGPATGKDIKVTNDTTGSSSIVTLAVDNANLLTHITGFTLLETAQDSSLAVSEYHELDLSWKDRIEFYPVFVTKGLSEGYHTVRITIDEVRDSHIFYGYLSGKIGIYYSYSKMYGQSETEPYKTTPFRDNNSKLYIDEDDFTKANLYLGTDKEICTSTGRSLNYWSVEQQYPVSRVDDSYITGTDEKPISDYSSTLQIIGESDTGDSKIYFTPGSNTIAGENHQRVGFYIADKKVEAPDPYTSIDVVIHNASDEQQGNQIVKLYDDIVDDDWNYWELSVTLNKGETYHYHVFMVDRVGGIATLRSNTSTTGVNFVEMYKPYTGLYEDNDVIIFRDTSGSIITERLSNGDAAGARYDESTLDIMGVDFSNDSIWDTWEYEEYIGVDIVTGRVKFPPGYNAHDYWVEFNFKELTTTLDAKSILRHGEAISVEDSFRNMETDVIFHTMHSDGTVTPGDLTYITTSTGASVLTKYSIGDTSNFYAIIGICHSIPDVNKIGTTNPVNIALKGKVKLNVTSTFGWSVGMSAFLKGTTGALLKDSEILNVNWWDYRRLGVVIGIETDTYLLNLPEDSQLIVLYTNNDINFIGKVSNRNKFLIKKMIESNDFFEINKNLYKIILHNRIYIYKKYKIKNNILLIGSILQKTNDVRLQLMDRQTEHLLQKSENW